LRVLFVLVVLAHPRRRTAPVPAGGHNVLTWWTAMNRRATRSFCLSAYRVRPSPLSAVSAV
jgi:hypothetical protein